MEKKRSNDAIVLANNYYVFLSEKSFLPIFLNCVKEKFKLDEWNFWNWNKPKWNNQIEIWLKFFIDLKQNYLLNFCKEAIILKGKNKQK